MCCWKIVINALTGFALLSAIVTRTLAGGNHHTKAIIFIFIVKQYKRYYAEALHFLHGDQQSDFDKIYVRPRNWVED